MTTLALARKKWARKMSKAGPIWKAHVTDKTADFAKGMASFLGLPDINPVRKTAYTEGVGAVSASDFAEAVKGKDAKWEKRLREAFA